jgi:hypothetical protein
VKSSPHQRFPKQRGRINAFRSDVEDRPTSRSSEVTWKAAHINVFRSDVKSSPHQRFPKQRGRINAFRSDVEDRPTSTSFEVT